MTEYCLVESPFAGRHLDAIRHRVRRGKKCSSDAVKQKEEGVVQLGFKFTRDGTVTDPKAAISSLRCDAQGHSMMC